MANRGAVACDGWFVVRWVGRTPYQVLGVHLDC